MKASDFRNYELVRYERKNAQVIRLQDEQQDALLVLIAGGRWEVEWDISKISKL